MAVTDQPSYSVTEVVRLALPPESTYLVPAPKSPPRVVWAQVVGLPLRRESLVEAGDLAFLLVRSDQPDWDASVQALAEMGVAGIVVEDGAAPRAAVKIAEKARLALVALPAGTNIREIHKAVLRLLTNPGAQLGERQAEVYGLLSRMLAEGDELQQLAEAVAEITGKGVLVQDKRLLPAANVPYAGMDEDAWHSLCARLEVNTSLPEGWSNRRTAAEETVVVQPQVAGDNLMRLVAPIVVKDVARGYVSLIGRDGDFDTFDTLVTEQTAVAAAMEMSRTKAVNEATKRWRGEFIDAVLSRSVDAKEIRHWANRIGYDSDAPHAVVVWGWGGNPGAPSMRRLETVVNGEVNLGRHTALVRAGEDQVAAFVALDSDDSLKAARALAEAVQHQLAAEFPKAPSFCGIGRPVTGASEWVVSHREAQQSLRIAERIDNNRPMEFADLSVHRLLFQLEDHPELADFCNEMLGALLRYDSQHNSTLVETLTAYFDNHGNLSETAKALYIHRNTLQYRMERISQIAGFDLQNPERRLAVQLALKAYRLLPSDLWDDGDN